MKVLAVLLLAACSREGIVYAPPDLAERPSPFSAQCDNPPDGGLPENAPAVRLPIRTMIARMAAG